MPAKAKAEICPELRDAGNAGGCWLGIVIKSDAISENKFPLYTNVQNLSLPTKISPPLSFLVSKSSMVSEEYTNGTATFGFHCMAVSLSNSKLSLMQAGRIETTIATKKK